MDFALIFLLKRTESSGFFSILSKLPQPHKQRITARLKQCRYKVWFKHLGGGRSLTLLEILHSDNRLDRAFTRSSSLDRILLVPVVLFYSLLLFTSPNANAICAAPIESSYGQITLSVDQKSPAAAVTGNALYYEDAASLSGEIDAAAEYLCTVNGEFACTVPTDLCLEGELRAGPNTPRLFVPVVGDGWFFDGWSTIDFVTCDGTPLTNDYENEVAAEVAANPNACVPNLATPYAKGSTDPNVPTPFTLTAAFYTNPTISGNPATSLAQDSQYTFTPEGADVDGDTLTFGIVNKPAWARFDSATGTLAGSPTGFDVDVFNNIQISVTDERTTVSLPAFSITVNDLPDLPIISGTPATSIDQDQPYLFTPTAVDADGDTLTFSIVNKPSWATFDTATGTLSGTPGNADVGFHPSATDQIIISVTDAPGATVALAGFRIEVVNVNDAPTITGTPAITVDEDSAYSFTPTAADPDGDALTFSIANKPSWATFDTATGTLSGTPGNADVGTTGGIVITVSDGDLAVTLPAFTVTVFSTPGSFCGLVIDGRVAEATVYGDLNNNGILDDGEPFAKTDSEGDYGFSQGGINYCALPEIDDRYKHCLNFDPFVGAAIHIRVVGGRDISTGERLPFSMSAVLVETDENTDENSAWKPRGFVPVTLMSTIESALQEINVAETTFEPNQELYEAETTFEPNDVTSLLTVLSQSSPAEFSICGQTNQENEATPDSWHDQPVASSIATMINAVGNSVLADQCASKPDELVCRTDSVVDPIADTLLGIISDPGLCTLITDGAACRTNTVLASQQKKLRSRAQAKELNVGLADAVTPEVIVPELTKVIRVLNNPVNLRSILDSMTEGKSPPPDNEKLQLIAESISSLNSVILGDLLKNDPNTLVHVIKAVKDLPQNISSLLTDTDDQQSAIKAFTDATSAENLFMNIPFSGDEPNNDNDALIDALDPDDDNDGVLDLYDYFPENPSEIADTDGDGVGDNADAFPNDSSETIDSDGDGIGDNEDDFPSLPNHGSDRSVTIRTKPISNSSGCGLVDFNAPTIASKKFAVASDGIGFAANFSLSGCATNTPEIVDIYIDLGMVPAKGSKVFKIRDNGDWVEIKGATIKGSVVHYSLLDNGEYDLNRIVGAMRDPVTVAIPVASVVIPIKTLPPLGLLILVLLSMLIGLRKIPTSNIK